MTDGNEVIVIRGGPPRETTPAPSEGWNSA